MSILSQKIDAVIVQMSLLHADSAEMSTPAALVNEMLNKLPAEIWQDSTKTFLDPVCGRGIFGLCILQHLFDGLQSAIPDEQERVDHILKRQIFLCDTSLVMRLKTKAAFQRIISAARLVNTGINIYNINSLEDKFDMEFDVIVGNPPYQNGKNHDFYVEFVHMSKTVLKTNGHILFVTPNRIFIPSSKLYAAVSDIDLQSVSWDISSSFNVGQFICEWHAINRPQTGSVIIDNTRYVSKDEVLPSTAGYKLQDETLSIIKKVLRGNDNIFMKDKNSSNDLFITRQWRRWNSKTKIGGLHTFNPKQSNDGKWISCHSINERSVASFVYCESNVMRFITYLFSGGINCPPFLWKVIPSIDLSRSWTDTDIYQHFNLTTKEITHIEATVR